MSRFPLILIFCIYFACYSQATPIYRVVGGTNASEGQFPHQVSLRQHGSHICGGSIISRNFILTAAHCVVTYNNQGNIVSKDPRSLTVRLGTTDRFEGGVLMRVAEVICHENYEDVFNDIALLRLEKPIIFSDNIQSIRLGSFEIPAGAKVTISGWGRIKQGGDIPRKLQWNELSAISQKECHDMIDLDSDSHICLGHKPANGACNGDSGGPAMYNGEVVGIADFVVTGCGTSYPDGYTKVFYYVDWIKKHSDLL